jgi:hypothetical protein
MAQQLFLNSEIPSGCSHMEGTVAIAVEELSICPLLQKGFNKGLLPLQTSPM